MWKRVANLFVIVTSLVAIAILAGCAPVLVGGAATSAVVAHDRRTTGSVVEDQAIEIKAYSALKSDAEIDDQAHVSVTSYNQIALLTGQTPDETLRQRAGDIVANIEKVRHVVNELAIAAPTSAVTRTNDGLLTTKVKTKLFTVKNLDATRIKVVTEDSVVYLMGIIDHATGDAVAELVATMGGVKKVVKLFEQPTS